MSGVYDGFTKFDKLMSLLFFESKLLSEISMFDEESESLEHREITLFISIFGTNNLSYVSKNKKKIIYN